MRIGLLWFISLLVGAAGCKSAPSSPAPSVPIRASACPGGSATGEWSGTETGLAGNWTFAGTLWQEGTKLRGTLRWNNTDDGSVSDLEVEGSVQCDTRTFTLCTVKATNQFGEPASSSFSGSLSPNFASMSATWDNGGKLTAQKR
jgi:hypothetical protein